ncbi:MAG TPA: phosphoribosylamine--glycine ligase, partial [Alphaproteobacteria bacterium]|nr:phosphoribosylamine--glycine ligase [Alphaproteobacteria bacterium]
LLIGSGGREHALAWALRKSPLLDRLYCAPGNGGIAALAECVALDPLDFAAVTDFVRAHDIGFVIVGPEAPLVAGLVDHLFAAGIMAFGPTAAAARLEGSKGFTKDLCAANAIPTAAYARFSDAAAAKIYIRQQGAPIVIKADGLAAGKGVILAETLAEAEAAVDDILGGAFGAAGAELVVEEFLYGEEASFFVLVDGKTALPLATAQDHKRVGDGDMGPNTGGMGAYSPAPVMTDAMVAATMARIIEPTVAAMAAAGTPFKGVLFAGLMITDKGPYLIEYNARFGDPECQVLMARLQSDLLPALLASADGRLEGVRLNWSDQAAVTVVMAARGYPGDYGKGDVIGGLDAAGLVPGVQVFHAGTALKDGKLLSNGGRVLNITATGASVGQAVSRAYSAVDKVEWPGGFCRRDIAWRALERERQSG